MNKAYTLRHQFYPATKTPKSNQVGAKLILIAIALFLAFTCGKLFIKALDAGNVTRCQNYRATIIANPKVIISVDVQTVEMCRRAGVPLK